ncbi:MAG: SLBB domain-containing protein [Armatimonadota bacterium]
MRKNKNKITAVALLFVFFILNFAPVISADISIPEFNSNFNQDKIKIFNENIIKVSKLRLTQEMDKFIQNVDPRDYVVDTGDKIKVDIYGPLSEEFILIVNPSGDLFMPEFGKIHVAGMTLKEVKHQLTVFLNKFYRDCKYSIELVGVRTFKVSVTGEVVVPGSYMANPFYSVTDLLGEAGGIMPNASMFNIKIKRDGQEQSYNAYEVVFLGEESDKHCLKAGDIIYVPPLLHEVRVRGEVNRPGVYEITNGETVQDMIDMAAGFTHDSIPENVFVEREVSGTNNQEVIRIDLKDKHKDFKVMDGDIIVVPTKEIYQNYITIAGEFNTPQGASKLTELHNQKMSALGYTNKWRYEISNGAKVLDIVNACGGLTDKANLRLAQINRINEDGTRSVIGVDMHKLLHENDQTQNLELKQGDTLAVPPILDNVYVVGELKAPGVFPYAAGSTVKEYVVLAGGPLMYANMGNIKIIRGDHKKPEVYTVNMANMIQGKKSKPVKILPEDIIYVPRTEIVSYKDIFGVIQSVVNVYALKKIFE